MRQTGLILGVALLLGLGMVVGVYSGCSPTPGEDVSPVPAPETPPVAAHNPSAETQPAAETTAPAPSPAERPPVVVEAYKEAVLAEPIDFTKLVPLNKEETVLIDAPNKRLYLKSQIVLRQGALELLACVKQTKEHEAILAVASKAYVIHTGLLALGAEQGMPVAFDPEYRAPTGQKIEIYLHWTDAQGKLRRAPAQSWIHNMITRFYVASLAKLPDGVVIPRNDDLRYDDEEQELVWYGPMSTAQRDHWLGISKDEEFQKAIQSFFDRTQIKVMDADWVFAGSGFFIDETTDTKYYRAEDGDLICVANFPSAMVDVSVKSGAANETLLYEAFTSRIPPIGTAVTIELVPVFAEGDEKPIDAKPADESEATPPPTEAPKNE